MAEGVLAGLARWPVKSLGGEALAAARLDWRGLGGDRAYALLDRREGRDGRWLTVRQAPGCWPGRPPTRTRPTTGSTRPTRRRPTLRGPGRPAVWGWDDPGLERALADDLGLAVRRHRDLGGQQDLRASVLVTTEASRRAVADALGRPVELRRFRTNLHLELDAPPFAEQRWEGGRLQVGEVTLDLPNPCARCVIPTRDPDDLSRWPELLRWLHRGAGACSGSTPGWWPAGRVRVGDPVTVTEPRSRPTRPVHRLGRRAGGRGLSLPPSRTGVS